jgi:1,4-alpha-glucan branching enzyme
VFNATPVPRDRYALGVSEPGRYAKILDSDDASFGGSGYNRQTLIEAGAPGVQGYPLSIQVDLPPLGAMIFAGPTE